MKVIPIALAATSLLTVAPLAHAATVITIAGSHFPGEVPMTQELQGIPCASPNVCVEDVYGQQQTPQDWAQGLSGLNTIINNTSGQKVVFGYSEGAQIATNFMEQPNVVPDTSVLLIANPQRAHSATGGQGMVNLITPLGLGSTTPTNTAYHVTDIAQEYDGVADWPDNSLNALADANALAGVLYLHTNYTKVNPNDPNALRTTVGNTTYVLTPTQNLPLLEPLRQLGLTTLADQLNTPLKKVVDSAYTNRPATTATTSVVKATTTKATAVKTATVKTAATKTVKVQPVKRFISHLAKILHHKV